MNTKYAHFAPLLSNKRGKKVWKNASTQKHGEMCSQSRGTAHPPKISINMGCTIIRNKPSFLQKNGIIPVFFQDKERTENTSILPPNSPKNRVKKGGSKSAGREGTWVTGR
ncbi:hypothetical protein L0665_09235 [Methanogenium marinum]|uniref:Uncharacterized protein n=1 Tax=Methanogenium marinum TaxID=348610 RepID=A0A9Q4KUA6_9EURY|nr:hypothetical protein [Methanogenium marinum]MDE4908789.1 hypothetical protein [Methanogenium marinum]